MLAKPLILGEFTNYGHSCKAKLYQNCTKIWHIANLNTCAKDSMINLQLCLSFTAELSSTSLWVCEFTFIVKKKVLITTFFFFLVLPMTRTNFTASIFLFNFQYNLPLNSYEQILLPLLTFFWQKIKATTSAADCWVVKVSPPRWEDMPKQWWWFSCSSLSAIYQILRPSSH